MRRLLAIAAALVAALGLAAPAEAARRPFVYVVVVDGLDGDRVEQNKAPFIASLLAGEADTDATYYPRSSSVMPSVTNANHTAMMTGAYAERSGITGNAFAIYAPLEDEDSCVKTGPLDYTAMPTETSGENRFCARAEMTFEAIKRQTRGRGRRPTTAAILGKPKLGRIFAGQNIREGKRDVDHLWAPCASGPDDDSYCEAVSTNPVTGYAATDAIVMDEVVRTVSDGVMARGKLRRPKLTFVNLPQVDSAGHAFGTDLAFYDQAIGLADDEIERLVTTLRSEGIWDRSVLIVLSDHSMDTAPNKVAPSSAFSEAGIPDGSYLPVDGANGSAEHVFLANRRDPARHELLARMRAAVLAEPGVDEALYRRPNPADGRRRHTLRKTHPQWHLGGRRTGDLFLTTKPTYAFSDPGPSSNPVPGSHGGPQTADNFLALMGSPNLLRQRHISGGKRSQAPVNVDVAPTVMRLLGLEPPADNQGRVLTKALARRVLRR